MLLHLSSVLRLAIPRGTTLDIRCEHGLVKSTSVSLAKTRKTSCFMISCQNTEYFIFLGPLQEHGKTSCFMIPCKNTENVLFHTLQKHEKRPASWYLAKTRKTSCFMIPYVLHHDSTQKHEKRPASWYLAKTWKTSCFMIPCKNTKNVLLHDSLQKHEKRPASWYLAKTWKTSCFMIPCKKHEKRPASWYLAKTWKTSLLHVLQKHEKRPSWYLAKTWKTSCFMTPWKTSCFMILCKNMKNFLLHDTLQKHEKRPASWYLAKTWKNSCFMIKTWKTSCFMIPCKNMKNVPASWYLEKRPASYLACKNKKRPASWYLEKHVLLHDTLQKPEKRRFMIPLQNHGKLGVLWFLAKTGKTLYFAPGHPLEKQIFKPQDKVWFTFFITVTLFEEDGTGRGRWWVGGWGGGG